MSDTLPLHQLKEGKFKTWTLRSSSKCDINLIQFSPCASMAALVSKNVVEIQSINFQDSTSDVILSYNCHFEIEDLKWSSDSRNVLLATLGDCHFVVICCFDKDFLFSVQEPREVKLLSIEWMPDSQHLISISELNVFTFAHSLTDGRRILLPSICSSLDNKPLMAFSQDRNYLALIHYINSSYHVTLISIIEPWNTVWSKKCNLFSIQGLEWSPDSTFLTLWDLQRNAQFIELSGEKIQTIQFQDSSTCGMLTAVFAPNCELFATTCHKHQIVCILVYNLLTWQLSSVLEQDLELERTQMLPITYISCLVNDGLHHKYCSDTGRLAFSPCGKFLVSSLTSTSVTMWDITKGCQQCAIFKIQNYSAGFQWHPQETTLAMSIANGTLIVWKCYHDRANYKPSRVSTTYIQVPTTTTLMWSKRNIVLTSSGTSKYAIIVRPKKKHDKKML